MYIIVIEETDNDARLVRAALRKAFPEKQVLRYKKANDFFDGIVTVSQMGSRTTTTWPRRIWNYITATKKRRIFVPAMLAVEKASAIVTDEGGMLCHAAIVSRELNIPCVINTQHATKWLENGNTVVVDATKGLVTRE